MTEPVAESPRSGRGRRRTRLAGAAVAIVVLVAVAAGAMHWYRELRHRERTDDAFVEATLVLLSARVGGTVAEVPVDTNQVVHAGDVLVRLDTRDFAVRLARARADLDAARNQMAGAAAAAESAEAEGRAARVEYARAERAAQRTAGLFAEGVGSRQALDDANAARDAAAARVRALEQKALAERAVLGNEAPLRQAEAAVREAELQLSYTILRAPDDGVVGRKSVSPGENVAAGQPLLAFALDESRWVTANFKETQIGRMREGDPAEVSVDAFPGRAWRGHVESLSPATGARYALIPPDNATGNFTKVVQRVPVRVALDGAEPDGVEAPERLPLGLSVQVTVRVDPDR
jgi:membrane fusion protein (multidrug efflux system)